MTERYLEVAIKAAETSGHILVDYFEKLHSFKQKTKNIRDLVTEVDILSEENIKSKIRETFPDHGINAEESGRKDVKKGKPDKVWHIDALDGTVNYSQGIPLCAVSLALEEKGEITAGVVLNPFSRECYFSAKGKGAYLNGAQISVSKKKDVKDGLYVAAFSSASSKKKKIEYKVFGDMNDSTRGVLRIGSAALALAYLACGRIDGFWAKRLYPWDLAGGICIVGEAGGRISAAKGKKYTFREEVLIASNSAIHESLVGRLKGL